MSEATENGAGARMPVHVTDHEFCKAHDFPIEIPAFVLDAEAARRNHAQTLEQIAEGGGLSLIEIYLNVSNLTHAQGAALNLTNEKILPRLRELIGRRIEAAISTSQDEAIGRSLEQIAQTLTGGQQARAEAVPERCGWTPQAQERPFGELTSRDLRGGEHVFDSIETFEIPLGAQAFIIRAFLDHLAEREIMLFATSDPGAHGGDHFFGQRARPFQRLTIAELLASFAEAQTASDASHGAQEAAGGRGEGEQA